VTGWSFTSGKANHHYATFSLLIQRIDLNYPVPIRRSAELQLAVQLPRVQVEAVARWVVVPVSVQVEIAVQVREEVRLALSAVAVPVAVVPVRLAGQVAVVAALAAGRPESQCW